MKKFMAILLCITLVMPFASSTNVEAVSKTYTFTDSYITNVSLEYTGKDKELIAVVDNEKYVITCNFVVAFAACDSDGTIWLTDNSKNIYWADAPDYKSVYYFDSGELCYLKGNNDYIGALTLLRRPGMAYYLPTSDEIDVYVNDDIQFVFKVCYEDVIPVNATGATQCPTTPPASTSKPNSNSDKKPSGSSDKTGSKNAYSKVKVKGNTISLLNKKNKAVKKATLNKKTGVMKYNKKKVKGVKSASFSKKGSLVYLTKGKKAYYYIGKKRILIKKKVSAIKTDAKKFAVYLKLKNGKKVKISR